MIEYDGYVQKIEDTDFVYEVISEKFGNSIELLTKNAIIYGGCIRDILANKEIVEDLCIAVSYNELDSLLHKFRTDTKWLLVPKNNIDGNSIKTTIDFENIDRIASFRTIGDKIIHIVASSSYKKCNLQNSFDVARAVSIACCGVVMLNDGRVLEVVPKAYNDCCNSVLRLNKLSTKVDQSELPKKIKKLVAYGWKSEIEIGKIIAKTKAMNNKKTKNIGGKAKKGVEANNYFNSLLENVYEQSKKLKTKSLSAQNGDINREYYYNGTSSFRNIRNKVSNPYDISKIGLSRSNEERRRRASRKSIKYSTYYATKDLKMPKLTKICSESEEILASSTHNHRLTDIENNAKPIKIKGWTTE